MKIKIDVINDRYIIDIEHLLTYRSSLDIDMKLDPKARLDKMVDKVMSEITPVLRMKIKAKISSVTK